MRKTIVFVLLMILNVQVPALTLPEALSVAYQNYEGFKVIQAEFLMEIEASPQALSQFLPHIRADLGVRKNNTQSPTNPAAESLSVHHGVVIEQELLRGGGSMQSWQLAKQTFKAARSRLYSKEQELLLKAIKIYLDRQTTHEVYKNSDSFVKSNEKQLEAIKSRYKTGQSTKIDVANAEVSLARALLEKSNRFEEYQRANAEFEAMFGIQMQAIETSWPNELVNSSTDFNQFKAVVFAKNYDLAQAKQAIELRKTEANIRTSSILPKASIAASIGAQQVLGASGATNYQDYSLNLNVPILSRGGVEYSEIRKAKHNARRELYHFREVAKKIGVEIISIWENYSTMQQRKHFLEQAVQAAKTAVEGTKFSFNIGERSIIELLRVEDELYSATVKKIEVTRDILLSIYRIKALLGELTAKDLALKVNYFDPDKEYNKIKIKVIGF